MFRCWGLSLLKIRLPWWLNDLLPNSVLTLLILIWGVISSSRFCMFKYFKHFLKAVRAWTIQSFEHFNCITLFSYCWQFNPLTGTFSVTTTKSIYVYSYIYSAKKKIWKKILYFQYNNNIITKKINFKFLQRVTRVTPRVTPRVTLNLCQFQCKSQRVTRNTPAF
jgi:hypothetical protein